MNVEEEKPTDDILAKRGFESGAGVNLGNFFVSEIEESEPITKKEDQEEAIEDIAVGKVADIFSRGDVPGRIKRDGTVDEPPELDTITEYAIEGEKRLHFGLMIAMVVTWSAIGAIVGTELGPVLSALGLILMAGFGFWLGEIWIPKPRMHLLGITWVIISMKLLYGLAISMSGWGWIEPIQLGSLLLILVGVNIAIAQRHNEDAIAAQATLVLLVIGSAAGALYDQLGVAVMIGIGTLLMHGLAYLRHSGNLASLGIAVSYLWIGLHAISNNWQIGGLTILPFEDPLLLFLLMFGVTGLNAVMAAVFAEEDNWFSDAFNAMGLGKPGLWSVSVGLGMIGALLAIAAHRLETGYALAQLLLLISAFGPSYLVVRGVDWQKLQIYALWPAPILLSVLILMVQGVITIPVSEPWSLYAAASALITAATLLNHQHAVSDHVLWTGAIVIVILLTLLIPADQQETGARALIVSQAIVWAGLAWLALQRDSPSLAGTAVLAPWIWLLFFASDFEDRLISVDLIPINILENDLAIYMIALVGLSIPVNLKLGDTGVNLASRLAGMSELGARLRDSGAMRLWNIGFLLTLATILFITRPGALSATGLVILMGGLLLSHSVIIRMDRHQGTPRTILISWSISAIILEWQYGFGACWIVLLGLGSLLIVEWSEENSRRKDSGAALSHEALMPGKLITITLGMIAVMAIIIGLDKTVPNELNFSTMLPQNTDNLRIAALGSILTIGLLYLPRASKFERLLPPAMASIAVLVSFGLAANSFGDALTLYTMGAGFIATGAWLAAQGEIRSRMKQVRTRDERLATHSARAEINRQVVEAQQDGTSIRIVDAELIALAEKQKKRSKRRGSIGEHDLITGDIHHKPTIVLSFISVTIMIAVFFAWTTNSGLMAIALASFISILFIGIARWRADQVGLHLPDMMGVESPIAVTMGGLTLIHVASRVGDVSSKLVDQWGLLVMLVALMILAGISLLGRKDLGLRIPSALEAIVILLLLARMMTSFMGLDQLMVDPTYSELDSWRIPVWGVEIFLIGAVLLYEWVENERLKRNLGDHRGAAGRFGWVAMIIIVSVGPAGLIACILAIRNGVKWKQPAVLVGTAVFAPYCWFTLSKWVEPLDETTSYFAMALGVAGLALAIFATTTKRGLWTPTGLWIGHLLLPAAIFTYSEEVTTYLVVSLLLISTIAWLIGVITLRRAWRVIGAIDLVIAWLTAGKLLLGGASTMMALVMLLATATLLGLVTWIGQEMEEELANS
jgi:hypothetical protein